MQSWPKSGGGEVKSAVSPHKLLCFFQNLSPSLDLTAKTTYEHNMYYDHMTFHMTLWLVSQCVCDTFLQIYEDSIVLQSVCTNAREKLEKDMAKAKPEESSTESENSDDDDKEEDSEEDGDDEDSKLAVSLRGFFLRH